MLTVVSPTNTPVFSYTLGPEVTDGVALSRAEGMKGFMRDEGYPISEVLSKESGARPRLIPAINAALRAQRQEVSDAVVLLLDRKRCDASTLSWRRAVQNIVTLARTGRNAEVVVMGQNKPAAHLAIPGVENAYSLRADLPILGRNVGAWAFRADAFLTEVEILCADIYRMCRDIMETGGHRSLDTVERVRAQAGLSLSEGFWLKTENRGVVVMDAPWQSEMELPITLRTAAADSAKLKRRMQSW